MSVWPDYDDERLTAALLRVDLQEGRYLAVREYHHVVNHLVRSAAAACLLDREPYAMALIARAGARTEEWVAAGAQDRARQATYADLAATRGLLALALRRDAAEEGGTAWRTAHAFLRQTAQAPLGAVQNARLAAAALAGDGEALQAAARGCELADAGLGLPWKRLALAIDARDAAGVARAAQTWLRERSEATQTNEWGAYNDVPIEVSGALALAAVHGLDVRLDSNRILTRFRSL